MHDAGDQTEEFDTETARNNLERLFPNMRNQGYQITSPRDASHNCLAYAVGDKERKWQGWQWANLAGYYWPPDAKRGSGMEELIYAYEAIGFVRCDGSHVEAGFDKLALYMDEDGGWSHAAKQMEDGRWSSKVGNIEDIIHNSPNAFHGAEGYGSVFCFMKRPTERTTPDGRTPEGINP